MPSRKLAQLGRAWMAEQKRKGLSKVVHNMPGQRTIDQRYLKNELFHNQEGHMHSHVIQELAKAGAAKLIRELASTKVNLDTVDRFGRNAVHYASVKGKGIALMELIRCKATIDVGDRLGQTALHLAIESGNSLMVKELVLAKANLNTRDKAGRSPLLLAIFRDKKNQQCPALYTQSVPDYLVSVKAELGTVDCDGRNSLHYCVAANDVDTLEALSNESCRLGGNEVNAQDTRGISPLALAASLGNTAAVKVLLTSAMGCSTGASGANLCCRPRNGDMKKSDCSCLDLPATGTSI